MRNRGISEEGFRGRLRFQGEQRQGYLSEGFLRFSSFENGVEFFLNTKVEKIEKSENGYVIYESGTFEWKNLDGKVYNELNINNR